jgi:hypothetical protein
MYCVMLAGYNIQANIRNYNQQRTNKCKVYVDYLWRIRLLLVVGMVRLFLCIFLKLFVVGWLLADKNCDLYSTSYVYLDIVIAKN